VRFDAEDGKRELLARRIGENELTRINVMLAIVDAQRDYVSEDRNRSGVRKYARKFAGSPGKRDDRYWPTKAGESRHRARESARGGVCANPRAEQKASAAVAALAQDIDNTQSGRSAPVTGGDGLALADAAPSRYRARHGSCRTASDIEHPVDGQCELQTKVR
jgi:hypothetical protein